MTLDSKIDFEGLDKSIREPLERKGVSTLGQLADVYVNLEKLVGANTVNKPVNGELTKWLGEHKADLGVPEKEDGYKLPELNAPEGFKVDEAQVGRAQKFAHENNIPQDLFALMGGFMVQEQIAAQTALQEALDSNEAAAQEALKKDWGSEFDTKMEAAKAAASQLGYDDEFLNGLAQGFDAKKPGHGAAAMVQHFAKLGEMLGEAGIETGGGGDTPSEAQAAKREISVLTQDQQFQQNLNDKSAAGHKDALKRWTRLHEVAGDELLGAGRRG